MSDSVAHHPKELTMDENKRLHLEARKDLIRDLMQWTKESGDGGEYCISGNGNRLWLSAHEMETLLVRLDTFILNEYPGHDNKPMTIE